jgi:medium-chain acyl-[acyl-carrier-protein] hydrolase
LAAGDHSITSITEESMPITETITNNPWLAFARPKAGAKLRLFCFPYSGSGATIFRSWFDGLPAFVDVFPVQPPGRETRLREPPFTRITPLVQAAADGLLSYLDKSFAFFGHSVGALVAFELACYLRHQYDLSPVHLFFSGRGAPHVPDPDPPAHNRTDAEFIEEVRRYNGTPDEVFENPELLALFLPILRADFAVNEAYTYVERRPFGCPITAFGGKQDYKRHGIDLEEWSVHTTARFSLHMFSGDHFFLHSERQRLLGVISADLRQLVEEGDLEPASAFSGTCSGNEVNCDFI